MENNKKLIGKRKYNKKSTNSKVKDTCFDIKTNDSPVVENNIEK